MRPSERPKQGSQFYGINNIIIRIIITIRIIIIIIIISIIIIIIIIIIIWLRNSNLLGCEPCKRRETQDAIEQNTETKTYISAI